MSDQSPIDRRTALTALSTGTLAAVAGCAGLGGSDDDTGADDDSSDGNDTGNGDTEQLDYTWEDATWDSYWYSLYNMSTNIAMSGNGVAFPATDQQQELFQQRFPEMLSVAEQPGPPVRNPNLNMAPFTEGDPQFT
jgi:hypothetical protein